MDWQSPESRSRSLYERARKIFPGASNRQEVWSSPYPPYLSSGRGPWIRDVDGQRYLDLTGSLGVLIHGHAHPLINAAIANQVEHGTCFALPAEAEIRLGELLCGRVPGFERLRFTSSGAEAVASALHAARAFTGRSRIARVEGVSHGPDDLPAFSTVTSPDKGGVDPIGGPRDTGMPVELQEQVRVLPANDVATTTRLLETEGESIAAILVDPVPRQSGFEPLDPDYLALLREASRRDGALLVCDEEIAFRLGFAGAQGLLGIDPDLTVLGNIIGGGLPVGAVAGRDDVMAMFGSELETPKVAASGRFTGNPVTMAAGEAAMSLLDIEAFARLDALGELLREQVRAIVQSSGYPLGVTGTGSLFSFHPHLRPVRDYRIARRRRPNARSGCTGRSSRGKYCSRRMAMASSARRCNRRTWTACSTPCRPRWRRRSHERFSPRTLSGALSLE